MSAQNTSLAPTKRTAYFQYDFDVDGGAIGTIDVTGNPIPTGAIVTSGVIHVNTALVGAGATVAVDLLASEDILAATAITSFTLNALLDVVPDGAAANMVRCTSNISTLTVTVATAALTAGKFTVALEYFETL